MKSSSAQKKCGEQDAVCRLPHSVPIFVQTGHKSVVKLVRHGLAVLLCLIACSHAEASSTLVEWWSGGGDVYHIEDCVVGYEFTVGGYDLLVTALGFLDVDSDGLYTSHPVGVWDMDERLQGQGTVQGGTASRLSGGFRYEDVFEPFTLAANTTYVIGGWKAQEFDDVGLGLISSVTLGTGIAEAGTVPRYGASPSLAFPTGTYLPHALGYLDVNMEYQVVPEPTTWRLFMVGLAAIVASRPALFAKRLQGVFQRRSQTI